jgi:Rps23 Pro-64 3,4-dihydroxylase Tpa1-like proline 4-hydroxylase
MPDSSGVTFGEVSSVGSEPTSDHAEPRFAIRHDVTLARMPVIDFARWDVAALRAEWQAARPFPHVVIDGFLDEAALAKAKDAIAGEPHYADVSDLYEMMSSRSPVSAAPLLEVQAALGGPEGLTALAAITGKQASRVELRSYVYLAGSFLLPHSDCRAGLDRLVAYAYYLMPREASRGGELELFDVEMEGPDVVSQRSARKIEPEENRIVFFDVTPASLHQVCEVTWGARASLAGWFYR